MQKYCVVFSLLILFSYAQDSPCGDWEPFKDEKCFKVFASVKQQTFEDSERICRAATIDASSHLVSIKSAEEQQFLVNFLFNKMKVVDNVWIGARFHQGKLLFEQDGLVAPFLNWASGRPLKTLDDHCVVISSDEASPGKWIDELCTRSNVILCQKSQAWTFAKIQQTLLETIQQLEVTKNQLKETQNQLTQTQNQQTENKNQLTSQLTTTQTQLKSTQAQLEILQKNPIPVGFIYVQLGGQPDPTTLWHSVQWKEISDSYAGLFFRVVGGNAAQFGQTQEENSPRLTGVNSHGIGKVQNQDYVHESAIIANNQWSGNVWSGANSGGDWFANSFRVSAGEVRPRNQAARVWKRIG